MPREVTLASDITIQRQSHDGRGIASIDGKTCFVAMGLPEETVDVEVSVKKRRHMEAKVVKVKKASEHRVEAACPHFGVCGGCDLQHMSQTAQIELKQKTLMEQLEHFGQVKPKEVLPPLSTDPYGYRRKARIGVRYVHKKEKVVLGFREKQSRYLTDAHTCAVIHPDVEKLWEPLRALISALSIYEQIPQVEVSVGDDGVALILRHLEPLSDADLGLIHDFSKQHGIHMYLQPKGLDSIHKFYPQDDKLRLHYALPRFGVRLAFHPNDFVQVNAGINEKMIEQAIDLLELSEKDTVLDLFCGLGNFTIPMATIAHSVVGVEGDNAMTQRVMENAALNGLDNVTAYCQDLSADCTHQPFAKQSYSKILIDPARAGADAVIPLLAKLAAERIVYVSCNPATLARDAGLLVSQGYTLQSAGIMDMFTHTGHVEAMALFVKGCK